MNTNPLVVAVCKFINDHKDDIIDFAKDAADTAVEAGKKVIEVITEAP